MRVAPIAPAQRPARASPAAGADGEGRDVSTNEHLVTRWTAADTVAGFLATLSILASLLALAYRPVRILPFAIVLALAAAVMSERNQRLAGWAIAVAVVCWTVGMTIAVVTESPLW